MSEAKSLKRPMDLSGEWRLKKVEGDLDQFFKDMGYSYLVRKAAALVMLALRKTEIITMNAFKFQCTSAFHLGDIITSLQKSTLVVGGTEVVLYSTISGGIGAFIPIKGRREGKLLSTLEIAVRSHGGNSLLGRDPQSFRSVYFPVKSIIDGDTCELFY